MTMQLIRTATVGVGGVATISFTGIPQDATDLLILTSARNTGVTDYAAGMLLSFNGSTSLFTGYQLTSTNATRTVGQNNNGLGGVIVGAANTANTFGNTSAYITNYASSNIKNYYVDSNALGNAGVVQNTMIANSYWNNTAAITSITITCSSLNFAENSAFSLYKITKGSDGITVVT